MQTPWNRIFTRLRTDNTTKNALGDSALQLFIHVSLPVFFYPAIALTQQQSDNVPYDDDPIWYHKQTQHLQPNKK
jgi:hypothetical protein